MIIKNDYIIFDAEPFCFGPISTTINLVNFLTAESTIRQKYQFILLGCGTSKQLAEASKSFDIVIECNTTDCNELRKYADLIRKCSLYISTTNPHSINYLHSENVKTFYIDTLFWMWGELRANFSKVDKYFIQRYFNIDRQIDEYAKFIKHPCVVNPLISYTLNKSIESDFILINLGGIDTVYHRTSEYYSKFVEKIAGHDTLSKNKIVIGGGGETIKRLRNIYTNDNLEIDCFGKLEFESLFSKCKKYVSAPGLTSINESYVLEKDVFFFPPQNYSQYLNLTYARNNIDNLKSITYSDIFESKVIPEYLPEEEGISLVKELSLRLTQSDFAMKKLVDAIDNFVNSPRSIFKLPNEIAYTSSGVVQIANEIVSSL